MGWATVADVAALTARTVDDATLTLAQSMVETFVDRSSPDDDAAVSPRDLGRLRKAVAWQAVWLADNPGVESRALASSIAQDGVTATVATRDAVVLAPLAKRAIRNLQFRRRNTVRLVSDFEAGFGVTLDPNSDFDRDDDDFAWTPLNSSGRPVA